MADKREFLFNFFARENVSANLKKAGQAVGNLGDDFTDAGKAADKLETEISDVEKSLRALAVQFTNTGDDKFFKQIREGEKELRKLKKTSKLVSGLGEDMAEGVSLTFSQRLGPLLASAPVGPAGLALGAAMAPTLGAAVAGAVVGGAGIGGVVGGLVLASKNPAVKAAGKSLGQEMSQELEESAQVFVKPALEGIGIVRKGFREIKPEIDNIFGDSSQFVKPLVTGAVKGAQSIVEGVADAVHEAGPVIDAFGRGFEEIGGAVGEVFSTLSEDADEGASAIDDLTMSTKNFILVTGDLIHGVAQVKGWLDTLDEKIDETRFKLEDRTGWDITADGMSTAERRAKDLAAAQADVREKLDFSAQAARGQVSALDELADSLRAQTDPTFALIEAQDDLSGAQKTYNDAVAEHGRKSPEAQKALRDMAAAAITLQGAAGSAAGTFNGSLTPAMRATLKSAGLTETEINDLEKQFREAKAAGERFAKNYKAHATIAWEVLPNGATFQNGVPSYNFPARASGGPVKAGQPYLVGEEGPELVTPTKDGYVHDAAKTAGMMAGGTAGGSSMGSGGTSIVINHLELPGVQDVARLVEELRKYVRLNAQGNAQVAFGGR
ncbi:hypothetical protein V6U89_29850 [Micromonospora sp. CPCC 206171]|uniref:hypothetical protein n=1 Tax=Micromonospora sp. CPCC 206171 TaxID=3122405 RepID=UPI002FF347A7